MLRQSSVGGALLRRDRTLIEEVNGSIHVLKRKSRLLRIPVEIKISGFDQYTEAELVQIPDDVLGRMRAEINSQLRRYWRALRASRHKATSNPNVIAVLEAIIEALAAQQKVFIREISLRRQEAYLVKNGL